MENTGRRKPYCSVLWLGGCFAFYMVIVPTITHYVQVLAAETYRPLPMFYWSIVSNLLLGAVIVLLAVKLWSGPPTVLLLGLEGLVFVYTFLTLFRGGNNGLWLSVYLPDHSMRVFFLGVIATVTVRSVYLCYRTRAEDRRRMKEKLLRGKETPLSDCVPEEEVGW